MFTPDPRTTHDQETMTTVAVIGGGAAGLAAARTLSAEGLEVVLIEAAPRLGGNCFGVDVNDGRGRTWTVDAGVSDFNRTTFTEFARAIDEFGLSTRPIGTDTSYATVDGLTRATCRSGLWQFDPAIPGTDGLPAEIERFRTRVAEVLEGGCFAGWKLGRYLDHIGASQVFRDLYLYPRAIGCFPMPDGDPADLPLRGLVEFWTIHGVVGERRADRHCVVGGMHRYPEAFAHWFTAHGGEVLCGSRVLGVVRDRWSVEVRLVDRDDRHRRLKVAHVVLANSPNDALAMLEAPAPDEVAALRRFVHQRARLVVHGDHRLVGHDRDNWGAFHYLVPSGRLPRVKPTITFFPNRLAGLPAEAPDVFVTMNPHREPAADKVFAERFFLHPVATVTQATAAAELDAMQGHRRTWYAGGYLRSPFVHESAWVSGVRAAERLIRCESTRPGYSVTRRRRHEPPPALVTV